MRGSNLPPQYSDSVRRHSSRPKNPLIASNPQCRVEREDPTIEYHSHALIKSHVPSCAAPLQAKDHFKETIYACINKHKADFGAKDVACLQEAV